MKDNSYKTAIKRKKLSLPAQKFKPHLQGEVLDFGCGRGDDADTLGIAKYDPHFFPDKPTYKFDTIMMIYVLNTIPNAQAVIMHAEEFLKVNGTLMIACRTRKEIEGLAKKNNWQPHGPGWTTGRDTFQCGVSLKLLKALLVGYDFVEEGESPFTYLIAERKF